MEMRSIAPQRHKAGARTPPHSVHCRPLAHSRHSLPQLLPSSLLPGKQGGATRRAPPPGSRPGAASTCASCSLESTRRSTIQWRVSVGPGRAAGTRAACALCVSEQPTNTAAVARPPLLHSTPNAAASSSHSSPPAAGVLALPADAAGDLAAVFGTLWHQAPLPPLMQAGVMEAAGVLRHYVLVHDAASMGPEVLAAAQEKLRVLAATLGSSCQLLSINSGGGGAPVGPRLWADALHGCLPGGGGGEPAERPPAPPGGLGAALSEADMSALATFVHELAARHVIPHLEGRVRALNVQVRVQRACRRLLGGGGVRGGTAAAAARASLSARAPYCLSSRPVHPCLPLQSPLAGQPSLSCGCVWITLPTGHRQPQGPQEPAQEPAVAQGQQQQQQRHRRRRRHAA